MELGRESRYRGGGHVAGHDSYRTEVVRRHGISRGLLYPKTIRLDNGPEFISRELDLWAFMHDVTLDFSRPGKPTDTGA